MTQTIEREMGLLQSAEGVPGAGNVFRCEGEYWTLAHQRAVCRVRDTKGLHHIAHLLSHTSQEFHACELVVEAVAAAGRSRQAGDDVRVTDLGDAWTVLDATAKAAYKRRLEELREELEEAERFNDPGRAGAAREEIEVLTDQLTVAVGLSGRDRKTAAHAERTRLTITKRIKDAPQKIRDAHSALGYHLSRTIKTGYFRSYRGDADDTIAWSI